MSSKDEKKTKKKNESAKKTKKASYEILEPIYVMEVNHIGKKANKKHCYYDAPAAPNPNLIQIPTEQNIVYTKEPPCMNPSTSHNFLPQNSSQGFPFYYQKPQAMMNTIPSAPFVVPSSSIYGVKQPVAFINSPPNWPFAANPQDVITVSPAITTTDSTGKEKRKSKKDRGYEYVSTDSDEEVMLKRADRYNRLKENVINRPKREKIYTKKDKNLYIQAFPAEENENRRPNDFDEETYHRSVVADRRSSRWNRDRRRKRSLYRQSRRETETDRYGDERRDKDRSPRRDKYKENLVASSSDETEEPTHYSRSLSVSRKYNKKQPLKSECEVLSDLCKKFDDLKETLEHPPKINIQCLSPALDKSPNQIACHPQNLCQNQNAFQIPNSCQNQIPNMCQSQFYQTQYKKMSKKDKRCSCSEPYSEPKCCECDSERTNVCSCDESSSPPFTMSCCKPALYCCCNEESGEENEDEEDDDAVYCDDDDDDDEGEDEDEEEEDEHDECDCQPEIIQCPAYKSQKNINTIKKKHTKEHSPRRCHCKKSGPKDPSSENQTDVFFTETYNTMVPGFYVSPYYNVIQPLNGQQIVYTPIQLENNYIQNRNQTTAVDTTHPIIEETTKVFKSKLPKKKEKEIRYVELHTSNEVNVKKAVNNKMNNLPRKEKLIVINSTSEQRYYKKKYQDCIESKKTSEISIRQLGGQKYKILKHRKYSDMKGFFKKKKRESSLVRLKRMLNGQVKTDFDNRSQSSSYIMERRRSLSKACICHKIKGCKCSQKKNYQELNIFSSPQKVTQYFQKCEISTQDLSKPKDNLSIYSQSKELRSYSCSQIDHFKERNSVKINSNRELFCQFRDYANIVKVDNHEVKNRTRISDYNNKLKVTNNNFLIDSNVQDAESCWINNPAEGSNIVTDSEEVQQNVLPVVGVGNEVYSEQRKDHTILASMFINQTPQRSDSPYLLLCPSKDKIFIKNSLKTGSSKLFNFIKSELNNLKSLQVIASEGFTKKSINIEAHKKKKKATSVIGLPISKKLICFKKKLRKSMKQPNQNIHILKKFKKRRRKYLKRKCLYKLVKNDLHRNPELPSLHQKSKLSLEKQKKNPILIKKSDDSNGPVECNNIDNKHFTKCLELNNCSQGGSWKPTNLEFFERLNKSNVHTALYSTCSPFLYNYIPVIVEDHPLCHSYYPLTLPGSLFSSRKPREQQLPRALNQRRHKCNENTPTDKPMTQHRTHHKKKGKYHRLINTKISSNENYLKDVGNLYKRNYYKDNLSESLCACSKEMIHIRLCSKEKIHSEKDSPRGRHRVGRKSSEKNRLKRKRSRNTIDKFSSSTYLLKRKRNKKRKRKHLKKINEYVQCSGSVENTSMVKNEGTSKSVTNVNNKATSTENCQIILEGCKLNTEISKLLNNDFSKYKFSNSSKNKLSNGENLKLNKSAKDLSELSGRHLQNKLVFKKSKISAKKQAVSKTKNEEISKTDKCVGDEEFNVHLCESQKTENNQHKTDKLIITPKKEDKGTQYETSKENIQKLIEDDSTKENYLCKTPTREHKEKSMYCEKKTVMCNKCRQTKCISRKKVNIILDTNKKINGSLKERNENLDPAGKKELKINVVAAQSNGSKKLGKKKKRCKCQKETMDEDLFQLNKSSEYFPFNKKESLQLNKSSAYSPFNRRFDKCDFCCRENSGKSVFRRKMRCFTDYPVFARKVKPKKASFKKLKCKGKNCHQNVYMVPFLQSNLFQKKSLINLTRSHELMEIIRKVGSNNMKNVPLAKKTKKKLLWPRKRKKYNTIKSKLKLKKEKNADCSNKRKRRVIIFMDSKTAKMVIPHLIKSPVKKYAFSPNYLKKSHCPFISIKFRKYPISFEGKGLFSKGINKKLISIDRHSKMELNQKIIDRKKINNQKDNMKVEEGEKEAEYFEIMKIKAIDDESEIK